MIDFIYFVALIFPKELCFTHFTFSITVFVKMKCHMQGTSNVIQ